jgi:hypothetical protein
MISAPRLLCNGGMHWPVLSVAVGGLARQCNEQQPNSATQASNSPVFLRCTSLSSSHHQQSHLRLQLLSRVLARVILLTCAQSQPHAMTPSMQRVNTHTHTHTHQAPHPRRRFWSRRLSGTRRSSHHHHHQQQPATAAARVMPTTALLFLLRQGMDHVMMMMSTPPLLTLLLRSTW